MHFQNANHKNTYWLTQHSKNIGAASSCDGCLMIIAFIQPFVLDLKNNKPQQRLSLLVSPPWYLQLSGNPTPTDSPGTYSFAENNRFSGHNICISWVHNNTKRLHQVVHLHNSVAWLTNAASQFCTSAPQMESSQGSRTTDISEPSWILTWPNLSQIKNQ